jgi:hypothetical protein
MPTVTSWRDILPPEPAVIPATRVENLPLAQAVIETLPSRLPRSVDPRSPFTRARKGDGFPCEQYVLGALMKGEAETSSAIISVLRPWHFGADNQTHAADKNSGWPRHVLIFDACAHLFASGHGIDRASVSYRLEADGWSVAPPYLLWLENSCSSPLNYPLYLDGILEASARRHLRQCTLRFRDELLAPDAATHLDLLQDALRRCYDQLALESWCDTHAIFDEALSLAREHRVERGDDWRRDWVMGVAPDRMDPSLRLDIDIVLDEWKERNL